MLCSIPEGELVSDGLHGPSNVPISIGSVNVGSCF